MKRLSHRQKQRLAWRSRMSAVYKLREREKRRGARRAIHQQRVAAKSGLGLNTTGRDHGPARRRQRVLVSPTELDFGEHYAATVNFLNRVRRTVLLEDRPAFLALRDVSWIAPEAALVLAAELSRCQMLKQRYVNGVDPEEPQAALLLSRLGFHRMLNFNSAVSPSDEDKSQLQYIRMVQGTGDQVQLFDQLKRIVFGNQIQLAPGATLEYDLPRAMQEAVLNVLHHAYDSDIRVAYPVAPGTRWWMAGLRDRRRTEIVFMFYDQGVGIPASIIRKWRPTLNRWIAGVADKLSVLRKVFDLDHTFEASLQQQSLSGRYDGKLIEFAMQLGESTSGLEGRGKGLADLKRLIDRGDTGSLTILSGRGKYVYHRGGEPITETLPVFFVGTLIVWRLTGSKMVLWSSDVPEAH